MKTTKDQTIMEKQLRFAQFEDCDIYEIEISDKVKYIRFLGYFQDSENGRYTLAEPCFLYFPLGEFLKNYEDNENTGWYEKEWNKAILFFRDYDSVEKAEKVFSHYHYGESPQPLPLDKLAMGTPCGCYFNGVI